MSGVLERGSLKGLNRHGKSGRIRQESGKCPVCRKLMSVALLRSKGQDDAASTQVLVVPQHPPPTRENPLGCRGSGCVALDRFAT